MKNRFLLWVGIATLLLIGSAIGGSIVAARRAEATRNSAGTVSLATSPVVSNQVIGSALWNNTFGGLRQDVEDSLDRSGRGGMLAALRGIDGTVGAPSLSFTSETGTGLYRIGASDLGVAISGTKKLELTSSLFTVVPDAQGARLGLGVAPTTLLQVNGSIVSSNKGQVYVNGVGDHGYISIDTDTPASKETALNLNSNGAKVWEIYIPAGSTDLRFYNGADRVKLSSSGLTVGASGTAIAQITTGTGTFNGGTPATFTATVASGAKCVASKVQTGGAAAVAVSVTTTTLTVTSSAAGDVSTANYFCF